MAYDFNSAKPRSSDMPWPELSQHWLGCTVLIRGELGLFGENLAYPRRTWLIQGELGLFGALNTLRESKRGFPEYATNCMFLSLIRGFCRLFGETYANVQVKHYFIFAYSGKCFAYPGTLLIRGP